MTTGDRSSKAATFRHHINCGGAAIEIRCEGGCLVLTATGEVDAANADTFVTAPVRGRHRVVGAGVLGVKACQQTMTG